MGVWGVVFGLATGAGLFFCLRNFATVRFWSKAGSLKVSYGFFVKWSRRCCNIDDKSLSSFSVTFLILQTTSA